MIGCHWSGVFVLTHRYLEGFSNEGLFDVFVVFLFVVVLLILFLSSLSLFIGFQILLVCFRACSA